MHRNSQGQNPSSAHPWPPALPHRNRMVQGFPGGLGPCSPSNNSAQSVSGGMFGSWPSGVV